MLAYVGVCQRRRSRVYQRGFVPLTPLDGGWQVGSAAKCFAAHRCSCPNAASVFSRGYDGDTSRASTAPHTDTEIQIQTSFHPSSHSILDVAPPACGADQYAMTCHGMP
jgi:hypothetical protein